MPSRYLCDVLEEMRTCHETRNYSYLLGLIEEVQTMGNRMEAALGDKKNYEYHLERASKARKDADAAEAMSEKVNVLRGEVKELEKALKKARDRETAGGTSRCSTCNQPFMLCGCNG